MLENNAQLEGHRTEQNDLKVKIELKTKHLENHWFDGEPAS